MNKTGAYFLKKIKNSCASTFNPRKSERFKYAANKVPGPGAYDLNQTNLSPDGKYFPSKFRSSLVRSFPHSLRKTVSMNSLSNLYANSAPGPGNYRLPSEFGHYIAKDATADRDHRISKAEGKTTEPRTEGVRKD